MLKTFVEFNRLQKQVDQKLSRLRERKVKRYRYLTRFNILASPHVPELYDDEVIIYLELAYRYQKRIRRRHIKKMNIDFSDVCFRGIKPEDRVDKIQRVLDKFATKGVVGKIRITNRGHIDDYRITLETLLTNQDDL